MKKKLIEVALPLDAINRESAAEKRSTRKGHPATLHLWWARRPLAACRAVLFATLVDDPSSRPDRFPDEEAQHRERERLFGILRQLIDPSAAEDENVVRAAQRAIRDSCGSDCPRILDPFCGGGTIPLEAQRLGLKVEASDLNPVAVLITRALVDIPRKFANRPPVGPTGRLTPLNGWKRAQGIAADVRYYGEWMLHVAEARVGSFYPRVNSENIENLTVIAWLWARTVTCPNPSCGGEIPLIGQMWLSKKRGKETWLELSVNSHTREWTTKICSGAGSPPPPTKIGGRAGGFKCPLCGEVAGLNQLKQEGNEGRIGQRLLAIIADGPTGRLYLPPDPQSLTASRAATPDWKPSGDLPDYSQAFPTATYGAKTFADLFTSRQTLAIDTFAKLVEEARAMVLDQARQPMTGDAEEYANAVATYLGLVVGRLANRNSAFCFWDAGSEKVQQPFAQQGINKTWDFCEANPFSGATGSWKSQLDYAVKVLESAPEATAESLVLQRDARFAGDSGKYLIVTDPPYYTNIGYSDLSDFFYVWLRRALQGVDNLLFSTLLTPKDDEIVAAPYRHGGRAGANAHFLTRLQAVFKHLITLQLPDFPMAVFYSFKQHEASDGERASSTGWEVMLQGLIDAGFTVNGTWPVRTENIAALKKDKAALATSIVLVCRARGGAAPITTSRDFLRALREELPKALRALRNGGIAPVDFAQAAIGPGMAIFSRYGNVLQSNGDRMPVRVALEQINQALDEVLTESETEYDRHTQWAVAWYEQFGVEEGPFSEAETLCTAKNTSLGALLDAGLVKSSRNKVRIVGHHEMSATWDPATEQRLTVWEVTQQLIERLQSGGEREAAALLRKLGGIGEVARDLAYRLYSVCERRGWADEAIAYNSLVVAWPEISRFATETKAASMDSQMPLT